MRVDARALAKLLLACPDVEGLHTGPYGAITTETAAGPDPGVMVAPQRIVLGLGVGARVDRDRLAARVRARLARDAPGTPVTLLITEP